MNKNLLMLLGISFLILSTPSHATLVGIVDHGDYLTDTTSGLDWLDVTKTADRSYYDVTTELGSGTGLALEGWHYASAADFGTLLKDSGVTAAITGFGQTAYLSEAEPSPQRELISLLGDTLNTYYYMTYGTSYCDSTGSCSTGDVVETIGLTSDLVTAGPQIYVYLGTIVDDDSFTASPDLVETSSSNAQTMVDGTIGSFLIRNTDSSQNDTSNSTVPEPASIALLGAGLMGMSINRKRKHKTRGE